MNWTLINDIVVLPVEDIINCDTRDFSINTYNLNDTERKEFFKEIDSEKLKNFLLLIKQNKLKTDKYFIKHNEILNWLKDIETASGGKAEWRMLSANINNGNNWNLKYIRFYKFNEDSYIVCNSYFIPIDYKQIKDNINKEVLNICYYG